MGTDQIIDLFSLEGEGKDMKEKEPASGKAGSKAILEGLDQLWDETEYEDLKVDDFLKNIESRRK